MAKMDGIRFSRGKIWQYLFIGVLLVAGLFIVYALFLKPKTSTSGTNSGTQGLATDQNGNPIEYVPTSTSISNINVAEGNTTTNTTNTTTNTPTNSNNTTTTNNQPGQGILVTGIANQGPTAPPVVTQPVGAPPQQPHYSTYVVRPGDTLSGIASRYATTWQNLFAINQSTVVSWANRHGNPIAGGPQNNIFPGEPILVPVGS